ncbi:MAG: N-6 DNA methylase [Nitrospinae bacterium]|nr:N-6 DNA methylase [Nitrospinota bacterium]
MSVPDKLHELVDRFQYHIADYKSGKYNETQVRRDFIDPLFGLLGWDIDNKEGNAEAYRDVIHEDSIKIGGATKAPDYCFRVGGTRKFFLEAKKPSIHIKEDVAASFQLRRYGWSARLSISILTDFEEFAVYDTRIKPSKSDKVAKARIDYIYFTDYPEHWDKIHGTFSKEAVYKGSFDKYVETTKVKKGTAQVDSSFLAEIETWRDALARNLMLRNPGLTPRQLNTSVQAIIDRIIFLRMCEDRGIESYGRLQSLLNGAHIYQRLCQQFKEADGRYNSGLFHFKQEKDRPTPVDGLTLSLKVDDKILKGIFRNLYYPDSPFEFSVLPTEILGEVYEQFLGKVIRVTGKRAVVEEKPEVKKAGGVYYTPKYIVDYIVENTVGQLLKDKKPGKAMDKLKVLDPACGSGSFLIGAYQYLLDWYREQYEQAGPAKHRKVLYKAGANEWRLTTEERKRILLAHIFGVDIDPQAVEVTKLALLLKVLEGESGETLRRQTEMFKKRVLPDLGGNIKCGNSLIGPDFYQGQQMSFVDEEEQYRINVFDWRTEFKGIMHSGGFDAVIGNPPYVRQEILGKDFKEYAQRNFQTYAGTADLYIYFIEKSHALLRIRGMFGMICSNKFMRANYGKALRNFLSTQSSLQTIVDFGELPVFQKAATFPCILLTLNDQTQKQKFNYAPLKHLDFQSLLEEVKTVGLELDHRSLEGPNWTLARREEITIIEKMKKHAKPLERYIDSEIYRGVLTGLNKAFVIDAATRKQLIKEDPKSEELIKPFLVGDDIRKYRINYNNKYLIFTHRGIDMKKFPSIEKYLIQFKKELTPKPKDFKGNKWKGRKPGKYQWYEIQDTVDYYKEFEKPKIIYPDIAKSSRLTFDPGCYFSGNTTYFIPSKDLFLLGVLNSKLIFNYYKRTSAVLGDADKGGRLRWFRQDVLKIPIRTINFSSPEDKKRQDQMVSLVERMLGLNRKLVSAKTAQEKTHLQRRIDATDQEIDQLVYQLYDLTEEEIAIVEESTQ